MATAASHGRWAAWRRRCGCGRGRGGGRDKTLLLLLLLLVRTVVEARRRGTATRGSRQAPAPDVHDGALTVFAESRGCRGCSARAPVAAGMGTARFWLWRSHALRIGWSLEPGRYPMAQPRDFLTLLRSTVTGSELFGALSDSAVCMQCSAAVAATNKFGRCQPSLGCVLPGHSQFWVRVVYGMPSPSRTSFGIRFPERSTIIECHYS